MNVPTDLEDRMLRANMCMNYTLYERDDATSPFQHEFASDQIPIKICPFVYHIDPMHTQRLSVEGFSIEINQGEMVAVIGAHTTGKATFMKLLGARIHLSRNDVD